MSETTTRTVNFKVDPALAAYLEWLEENGLTFDVHTFDLFAAGYRATLAAARADGREGE